MLTLHQLRCFLATLEHGSFTAAAASLGYAQPSLSEQVRLLERQLDTTLFRRVGRGLVPTEAATALQPHAAATLAAAGEAERAVARIQKVLTGTVRFGIFRTARFYLGADMVADVLGKHPGVRLELVGQNSAEIVEQIRRGRLEAALVALPVEDETLTVTPVLRDEVVFVSTEPDRRKAPVTARQLAGYSLVLPDVSWREHDTTRTRLTAIMQEAGATLRPRVEVEDAETALEIAASGLADTIISRGVLLRLGDRLPPTLGWASFRPMMYETYAIVHRPPAELSPATRAVVEIAATRMSALAAAVQKKLR
ncbi:LysR family transcriptional regulator [Virgisporangium aurantiacum]|uniref:LysR family transcriptional regulator n=1 Tax=Virgisporangium aurantiacum TaxID=175570 RepID=A0A8J4E546_9ACTN|nr:LysR family transcriptional regulator [Virgisporangium aurantiacum]GIJ62650.1 LysR family transcriptional regulator [Virgisporangium aurantiacum]